MYGNTEGTADDAKNAESNTTCQTHIQELSDTDLDTDTDDDDIIMIKNERVKMFTSLKDRIIRKKEDSEAIEEIDLTNDDIFCNDKPDINEVNAVKVSLCRSDSDSEDVLPVFRNKEQDVSKNINVENTDMISSCLPLIAEKYKEKYDAVSSSYGSSKNSQYPKASYQDKCVSSNVDCETESEDESLPLSSATVPLVSSQITHHPKRSYSTSQKTDNLSDSESSSKNKGPTAEGQPKKKRTRKTPEESLKEKEQAQVNK